LLQLFVQKLRVSTPINILMDLWKEEGHKLRGRERNGQKETLGVN